MNYRHHFHAGNFADVMKHTLWLQLLAKLTRYPSPLRVIDTHAGAGFYDLEDAITRRSAEAQAGVGRLMDDITAPPVFDLLKAAILAENSAGAIRYYPGSPLSTLGELRQCDEYLGCELRPDDFEALRTCINRRRSNDTPNAQVVFADGYAQIGAQAEGADFRTAHLIDPPFERADEYDQIISGVRRALVVDRQASLAIWAPLKDLETFDALLRGLEQLNLSSILVAEARLRPLFNPMKMNGSAMIFIGAPDMESEANAVCGWVAAVCGEAGGSARVRQLGV